MISTSPIKISCVVQGDQVTAAVKALHEAFELGADDDPRGAPLRGGAMSGYRVAVVGATGAVGTVMLAKLRERGFPASRDRPVRVRALRRPRARRASARVQPLTRRDHPGLRPGDLQRRRDDLGRVGAEVRRGRAASSSTTPRAGAVTRRSRSSSPRSTRTRSSATGSDRQPELLDDAADGRAQADPRHGGHRAPDRLHLPVRLRARA